MTLPALEGAECLSCGRSKFRRTNCLEVTEMLAKLSAILLLVLLAVLPAAGQAAAFAGAEDCAPASHTMTVEAHDGAAARTDCNHGAARHRMPCAMMGLCTMTGCMALTNSVAPEALALGQRMSFRAPEALQVDGLALAPPFEPPRA